MAHHVMFAADQKWTDVDGVPGLREAVLVGERDGAVHLEIALCELAAGAEVPAHLRPYEESWYVLGGQGSWTVGGLGYTVAVGDFGVAPVRVPQACAADGGGALRWLSVRAPKPPSWPGARRSVPVDPVAGLPLGRPSETDPRHRWAGHFDDADLGPYGPLSMPGYHGPNIRNIALHMLVDRLLGAQHHTLFMVEFAPRSGPGQAGTEHYHPFEEIYFLLAGTARGTLDGEDVVVSAGDLVWTGVDSTHAFVNEGDVPVRWLEVQSPVPPDSDAFFFPKDWRVLP
jgi:quercetin dioxygenase-like cupin family protein